LENLESLILDGNRIRTLDNNVFSTLIKLNTLSLSKLASCSIVSMELFFNIKDSSGTDETLLKVSLVIYGKWQSTSCKIKVPGGSLGI
jgi:hypothetical protein